MDMAELKDVPLARLDELIAAAQHATPATDEDDELGEIVEVLQAEKEAREVAVHHEFRYSVFRAIRAAATAVAAAHPDFPVEDVKAVFTEELQGLLLDSGANLSAVMDGTLVEP